MKFGVHSLVFTDTWNEANARTAIDAAARIGFDAVEVLVNDFTADDAAMTRKMASDAGIAVVTALVLPQDADLSSTDPQVAARGEAAIARALEMAGEVGSETVSGLLYAGLGRYRAPPTSAQRDQVVAALGRLDERAGSLGMRLGLEPINRYETYLVNTVDEAAAMISAIRSSTMFIHLDTYHMNIEESDIAGAIARSAGRIGYVHLADNNRAMPGTGIFDFKALFRALARAGYDATFTIESFSSAVVGPDVVAATALWRRTWAEPVEAARQGLDFVRAEVQSAREAIAQ